MAGLLRRAADTFKSKMQLMYGDYRRSTVDMFKDMYDKPVRTAIQLTSAGSALYLADTNPDIQDYSKTLLTTANSLASLPYSMRRRSSDQYVASQIRLRNDNMLELVNLGVCSLLFHKVAPDRVMTYKHELHRTSWAYTWFTLRERFIDIGYHGQWIKLEEMIVDYDLAEE